MSNRVTLRPTSLADLPVLAEFWYDKMALLQATYAGVRLAPDARQVWRAHYTDALAHPNLLTVTACVGERIQGALLVRTLANEAGLLPAHYALVEHLLFDLHAPRAQDALAKRLFEACRIGLMTTGITEVRVRLAGALAVEQAFWLSLGMQVNRYEWGMTL